MIEHILVVDDETTSLSRDRRAWEVGVVQATIDQDMRALTITGRLHAFVHVEDIAYYDANIDSLRIGGFFDRHPEAGTLEQVAERLPGGVQLWSGKQVAYRVRELAKAPDGSKRVWWGDVPDFDAWNHEQLLHRHGMLDDGKAPWDYHLHCFEVYARGWLAAKGVHVPAKHRQIVAALEVETGQAIAATEAEQHTAMGDVMEVVRGLAAVRGLSIVNLT